MASNRPTGNLLSEEDLRSFMKSFLKSLDQPLLRAARRGSNSMHFTDDQLYSILISTINDSTRSTELLKPLQQAIDESFGDLIDKEIERLILSNTNSNREKIQSNKTKFEQESASNIAQNLLEHRDLITFRAETFRRFQTTLADLVEKFDEEFVSSKPSNSTAMTLNRSAEGIVTDHGTIVGTSYDILEFPDTRQGTNTGGSSSVYNISYGSDSDTSLTNGSGGRHRSLMFLDEAHLRAVAENLSQTKSDKIRLRALNDLLKYVPNDAISLPLWKILCSPLIIALSDPNKEISMACLTLHSRLLAGAHINVVCETLVNIVDNLIQWFSSTNVPELSPNTISLDTQQPTVELRFKQIRLILEFLQETTKYWIRYSENCVEHIINQVIRLFSLGSIAADPNAARILPLHFVALLDPQSNWFRAWMHGTHSRSHVLKALSTNKNLLINAYQSVVNFAQVHSQLGNGGVDGENGNYSSGIRKRPIGTASSDGSTRSQIPTIAGLPSGSSFLNSLGSSPSSTTVVPQHGTPQSVPASSAHYTRLELNNVHFVHSIALLEHIICLKQARQMLFPMVINNEKQVTIKDILRILIQIMLSDQSGKPSSLICCHLLKRVCSESNICGPLMCNDELFEILMKPVKQFIATKKTFHDFARSSANIVSEQGLIHLAELFAAMASNDVGYQFFIRIPTGPNAVTPVSSIAHYVKRVLLPYINTRTSLITPDLSHATSYTNLPTTLVAEFLYACRLIYSRVMGLSAFKRIDLHTILANALKVENDRTRSPSNARSFSVDSEDHPNRSTLTWREILIDNLLLYGSTPKGMYLLAQSGQLSECVAYIEERWREKKQVGKLEKYGYGYLLSQMANTPAVIARLDQGGSIEHLIDQLWNELEYVPGDLTTVFPRRFPSEPISRYALKPLLSLLSIISSFSAIFELLQNDNVNSSTPHNNDENQKPSNILELLEYISFVSDENSIRRLLCYEHTHNTGLRLLSVMQSDLDVQLFLDTKYNYIKRLRQAQADMQNETAIIIDQLTVARNHVLVNGELYGGVREKYIPPWTLNENDLASLSSITLFGGTTPLPDVYSIKVSYSITTGTKTEETDLHRLLRGSRPDRLDEHWLTKCRHVFTATLRNTNEDSFPYALMPDVLDAVADIHDKLHIDVVFNASKESISSSMTVQNQRRQQEADLTKLAGNSTLSVLQELGVLKALNYAAHLGLIQDTSGSQQSLTKLLKALKTHLKQKSIGTSAPSNPGKTGAFTSATGSINLSLASLVATTGGDANYLKLNYTTSSDTYPGFDWFATTIFFMMGGDMLRSWRWLKTFSILFSSGFLWHARLFNSPYLHQEMNIHGIHPVYAGTGHCVELIVEQEMPSVFAAFRMSGFTISQIVVHWTKQCFWSILDWPDIISYICICILYGIDHQTYFCVALLSHLQQDIIYQHSSRNLLPFLKCHQIRGFSVRQAFEYMLTLEKKYRSIVISELKELVSSNSNTSSSNSKQNNS